MEIRLIIHGEKPPSQSPKIMFETTSNEILIETDYLIIGAGASGIKFLDDLFHKSTDTKASFVLAYRLSQPDGHRSHVYSFVQLHRESYFYGVNSEYVERRRGKLDTEESQHVRISPRPVGSKPIPCCLVY